MKFITAKDLANSNDGTFLILDIRSSEKFREKTVPNSINIDVYNDIKMSNFDEVRLKFLKLPKDKTIITVCNAGMTAQPASKILEEMGFKTIVLEHGMIGWNDYLMGD